MKKERIHKRFRIINPALLIIIFLAVLCAAYITIRFLTMLSQTTEAVTVTKMTAYESISGTGWLVRDEETIRSTTGENVKHLVSSGDKVGVGAVLAKIYSNEKAMESARQVDALDDEIELLRTATQSVGSYSDAAKVDQLISNHLKKFSAEVEDGICSHLSDYSNELRQLSLRRNAATLDVDSLQQEINSLTSQRSTLAQRIELQTSEIQADASGYYTEVVDGYETILTYDRIAGMSAADFEALVAQGAQPARNAFGKIVKGFSWYFAMSIPAEEAEPLTVGKQVTLRFSQISQDIQADVVLLNKDDAGGNTLAVFKGDYITNEILSDRKMNVEVILASYTGLKVPTSAVYLTEDKQLGVYILTGSTPRFKEITPVYKGENFYIVKLENSDKALVAGDNVIIQGLKLAEGKV